MSGSAAARRSSNRPRRFSRPVAFGIRESLRLIVLGSGSTGNVTYVESGPANAPTRLLIDAGLARAEIDGRLVRAGLPDDPHQRRARLAAVDALIVTHEHDDHLGSAATLGLPIWATGGTQRAADLASETLYAGRAQRFGAISVEPIALPHDAAETIGLVFDDGACRMGILTDCGHDAEEVAAQFAGCDVLVLETNHDLSLLRRGPYPPSIKRRIASDQGHLSNAQAASILAQIARRGRLPRVIIAAHLSAANNDPRVARRALVEVAGPEVEILVAGPLGAPAVTLSDGHLTVERPPAPPPPRGSQLSLFEPVPEPR